MGVYQFERKLSFTAKEFFIATILCVFILTQAGCGNREQHPDVSDIHIELQTRRLDRDLAYLDTNYIGQGLQQLKEIYPDFLDFYLDTLMGFGVHGNYQDTATGIKYGLKPFLTHKDIRGLFDTVMKHYSDTKKVEQDMMKGFQYLKHYDTGYAVPKIVYFISGLRQWSVITLDTTLLGIGLDMYLGEQYPFYHAVQIPQYVINKCKPEYIPVNVFQAIYRNKHPFIMEERNLLNMMIQRGKEQYYLSRILPETPDSLKFGFTQAQLNWCEASEGSIYNFFITQNLLYEKSPNKVLRYVMDGPTSAGMPPESPGNIGSWLGYKIIMAYVETHPGITLEELLALNDAQKILQGSKYKPK